jgi:hypothetical protein
MARSPESKELSGVCGESGLLAAICTADMVSTLWLVSQHNAVEANPIMAYWLSFGPLAFAVAKAITFLAPICVLEIMRRRRPEFVRSMLRLAIVLYVVTYGIGTWRVNSSTEAWAATDTYSHGSPHDLRSRTGQDPQSG